jgi:ABC-type lipoprotein export system ATPase subunit
VQTGDSQFETRDGAAAASAGVAARRLTRRHHKDDATVHVLTHDARTAPIADPTLFPADGEIVNDFRPSTHEILEALEVAAMGSEIVEAMA